jgi:pSer/pThr/pTyr-binding forkhead associated (FHA) protein
MLDPPAPAPLPSASELAARLAAERAGIPFLLYQDQEGAQVIVSLTDQLAPALSIGRGSGNSLRVDWDESISRVHAELVQVGEEWTLVDDGLSRNGSFVNGERVAGRQRLRSGDTLRLGHTTIVYCHPAEHDGTTAMAQGIPTAGHLSPAQRRVLVALARPYATAGDFATPATNQQIASELFLSVDAVKTHLRALGQTFGVQDLPQNQKRARLVERALSSGVITRRELAERPPA